MMLMMRGARGNGYRSWSKCVGMVGWLMHTHTGEQHCWRCSSKELEEFTTKFSALKFMQNNTSFLVSLLKTKDKVPKKKLHFSLSPLGPFVLFVCVKELGFSKRAVSGTWDNISKVLASRSKDRLVLGHWGWFVSPRYFTENAAASSLN